MVNSLAVFRKGPCLLEMLATMLVEHIIMGKNFIKLWQICQKHVDKYPFVTYSE